MKLYEYECLECGRSQTLDVPLSGLAISSAGYYCNECSGTLRRIFSSAPVHFHGSGFFCKGG